MKKALAGAVALAFAMIAFPLAADEESYSMISSGIMSTSTAFDNFTINGQTGKSIEFGTIAYPTFKSVGFEDGWYSKMTANSTMPILLQSIAVLSEGSYQDVFVHAGEIDGYDKRGLYLTEFFFPRLELGAAKVIGPGIAGLGINFNAPSYSIMNKDFSGGGLIMAVDFGLQAQYALTLELPFANGDFLETLRVNPSVTYNWSFWDNPQGEPFNSIQVEVDSYLKLLEFLSLNLYLLGDFRKAPVNYTNSGSEQKWDVMDMRMMTASIALSFHNIPFFDAQIGDNSY